MPSSTRIPVMLAALLGGLMPLAHAAKSAAAQESSAQHLFEDCQAAVVIFDGQAKPGIHEPADARACIGYVIGIADGTRLADFGREDQHLCMSPELTKREVVQAVFSQMQVLDKQFPGELKKTSEIQLAMAALRRAYPCEPKSAKRPDS